MPKLTEFYPELQGRPESKVAFDLEKRAPSIPPGHITGVMLKASYTTTAQADNYTASVYTVILVDASGNDITITLPAALANPGRYYYIKKIDSSGNKVTVKGDTTAETIDGEEQIDINLQYAYVAVLCDGTVWHIIGGEYVKMEDILQKLLEEQQKTSKELVEINKKLEALD